MMQSKRLLMRPAILEDTEIFHIWWNNGLLMQDVGFPEGLKISADDVRNTIEKHQDNQTLFVIETFMHQPIGELSYRVETSGVRIGMKIAEMDAQGKGYGKEALSYFCTWLFKTYPNHDILIDTLATNTRAIKLYQSIGANIVDVKKAFWTNPHGTVYDAIFFSLKKEQFKPSNPL
jgi:RimJ/RimL family protein N-acetyltransferase